MCLVQGARAFPGWHDQSVTEAGGFNGQWLFTLPDLCQRSLDSSILYIRVSSHLGFGFQSQLQFK